MIKTPYLLVLADAPDMLAAKVVVGYRFGWPDQLIIRGTLSDIRKKVRKEKITRTALILVGPASVNLAVKSRTVSATTK